MDLLYFHTEEERFDAGAWLFKFYSVFEEAGWFGDLLTDQPITSQTILSIALALTSARSIQMKKTAGRQTERQAEQ